MRQPVRRVLVIYKKSAYQLHLLERKDAHLRRLLRLRQPDVVEIHRAHVAHQRTLEAVVAALKRLGVAYELVYRADLRTVAKYDLLVSVGGDGTVLHASHLVTTQPLLGVNSDPARSEAVFCAATPATVEPVLRRVIAGRMSVQRLFRLQMAVNGRLLAPLALNDVLIAHQDPSTMSRYRLRIGSRAESQKSSGLWVASAAGSSSAVLASGGKRLPWTAARFQYRPRELYRGRLSRPRLTGGVLAAHQRVRVTWLMRDGRVFIDGPHAHVPLRFGDTLEVRLSLQYPLRLVG